MGEEEGQGLSRLLGGGSPLLPQAPHTLWLGFSDLDSHSLCACRVHLRAGAGLSPGGRCWPLGVTSGKGRDVLMGICSVTVFGHGVGGGEHGLGGVGCHRPHAEATDLTLGSPAIIVLTVVGACLPVEDLLCADHGAGLLTPLPLWLVCSLWLMRVRPREAHYGPGPPHHTAQHAGHPGSLQDGGCFLVHFSFSALQPGTGFKKVHVASRGDMCR